MEKILSLLADPAPGFICRAAGRQEPKPSSFIIPVTNELSAPADANSLAMLSGLHAEDLIPFYSRHDGISLFKGRSIINDFYPAFRLYGVSEFRSQTEEMREATGMPEEDLHEFQKNGIAFGEICRSGNYFVLNNGTVYYSDHDGGDDTPFAASFSLFLERIAAEPAKFLYEAGCNVRYSDGSTHNQWIPQTYVPDTGSV